MKKSVLIFVHTEYHLLISINQILSIYSKESDYSIEILIRASEKRLTQQIDLSFLPVKIEYFRHEVTIYKELSGTIRQRIQELLNKRPQIFIFFQEMDPLMVILANHFRQNGTEVCLYQDGLKPYVNLQFHSLGLLKYYHMQNIWLHRNKYPINSWLSPIWSKKFAHLKSIDKVYLTFPEAYKNWNNKELVKIDITSLTNLNEALKRCFLWDDALIPERNRVIFYMNQPMHDDGIAETNFLRNLSQKYPNTTIYIKLHPLTEARKVLQYNKLKHVILIESKIPAELFIMNLTNSIILSLNSTSMFINTPGNRYYYLFRILQKDIKRLSRYTLKRPPSEHIFFAKDIKDISF